MGYFIYICIEQLNIMIMSRIIVEYNPPLSVRVQKIIRNEVTPSMISNDETSCQYDIGMVQVCLDEMDIEDDLKLVNDLIEEGVHFLEF